MLRTCVSHSLSFVRLNVAEVVGIAAPAFSVKFIAFKKMVELMTYKNLSVRVVFKKHNLIRLLCTCRFKHITLFHRNATPNTRAENTHDAELVNCGNNCLSVIQAGSKRHRTAEKNAEQQLHLILLKYYEKSHKHQNNFQQCKEERDKRIWTSEHSQQMCYVFIFWTIGNYYLCQGASVKLKRKLLLNHVWTM